LDHFQTKYNIDGFKGGDIITGGFGADSLTETPA
jgi:hypothetical protein